MFTFIRDLIAVNKKTLRNSKGATMIEYALVVAAIAALVSVIMGSTGVFSTAIKGKMSSIASQIDSTP